MLFLHYSEQVSGLLRFKDSDYPMVSSNSSWHHQALLVRYSVKIAFYWSLFVYYVILIGDYLFYYE
jgi:hypothetical protein